MTDAGTRVERLSVIGGGARSSYWGRIIAAELETPLVYLKGGEVGPALGAARLAQVAADGGNPATVCAAPPVSHTIDPDPALVDWLADKKVQFLAAYPRITPKDN